MLDRKTIARALALVGVAAAPVLAQPRQGACADALTMTASPFYLGCRGAFEGNINGSASELTQLTGFGGAWNVTWTWRGKSDDANDGPFTGDPPGSSATGTIGFDAPLSGLFVIGIKQSRFYSYYLFNATSPISSIPIDSRGTAPDNAGFSHVGLYQGPSTVIPEPSTYALLGTGILGLLGVSARRRRKH